MGLLFVLLMTLFALLAQQAAAEQTDPADGQVYYISNPQGIASSGPVNMTISGPLHGLAVGSAGTDSACGDESNKTICQGSQTYVAALTDDGRISVDANFSANYPDEVASLPGGGWKSVALAGISNFIAKPSDPLYVYSNPKGFWIAAVDSQGKIHTSPTFNKYGGLLPDTTIKYKSIFAVQQQKDDASPAIIGLDESGKPHLPKTLQLAAYSPFKFDINGSYDSLNSFTMQNTNQQTLVIIGQPTDGMQHCSDSSSNDCRNWVRWPCDSPSVCGPYLDVTFWNNIRVQFGKQPEPIFLEKTGKIFDLPGYYKEIESGTMGLSTGFYAIGGKPDVDDTNVSAMPQTGVYSWLPAAALGVAMLGLVLCCRRSR